uniref:Secreted protein n=1 Tax=Ixodes scapularis TaxID=6945 RepID=A0A4D5RBE5_IXOSC
MLRSNMKYSILLVFLFFSSQRDCLRPWQSHPGNRAVECLPERTIEHPQEEVLDALTDGLLELLLPLAVQVQALVHVDAEVDTCHSQGLQHGWAAAPTSGFHESVGLLNDQVHAEVLLAAAHVVSFCGSVESDTKTVQRHVAARGDVGPLPARDAAVPAAPESAREAVKGSGPEFRLEVAVGETRGVDLHVECRDADGVQVEGTDVVGKVISEDRVHVHVGILYGTGESTGNNQAHAEEGRDGHLGGLARAETFKPAASFSVSWVSRRSLYVRCYQCRVQPRLQSSL